MPSFDQTIELMLIDLKQVEGTLILFAVCDDTVLRDYTIDELRKRLPPEITLRDFCYDPEHISLLEGTVETVKSNNGRVAVSVTGFETLPPDKRAEAIRLLNWERGRFGYTGAAVILWVNRATLAEIATKSADFYSWRSGTFIIEPPAGWDTLESSRRSYLNALIAQNEFVNLQGLAPTRGGHIVQMRMEDVFIPLRVEEEVKLVDPLLQLFGGDDVGLVITTNPRADVLTPVKQAGTRGEYPILPGSSLKGALRAVAEHLIPTQREIKARRVEISELLQECHAVILGDPGAGKTTLLRYLAYVLARAQVSNYQSEIIRRIPELARCLPVYIRIGEYAQHLQRNPEATPDAFAPLNCQANQLPLSDELLKDAMVQGRALFLLDGLDEIIETGRQREVARCVEEFARIHPQCRLIVTSRIVGYREAQLAGEFAQFTISPFADPEIRRFAENWYKALREPASSAERLVQAIDASPSVRRLAANPLLLTVIALIHWRGTKLPHHRAKLYSQAAETLVDQWMSQRRVSPEGWDVQETLQLFLPAIAWHLHSTTSSGLIGEHELHNLLVETLRQHESHLSEHEAHSRAAQFRRNVSEFSGIFLERGLDQDGRGLYGFLHLTFEEYFAAVRLADKWEREGKSVLGPLLHDPRWTEVILLTAGHLSESSQYRATRFVQTILSAHSEYEDILHRDLLLAACCLADDVRVDTQVRHRLSAKLLKIYFNSESPEALQEDIRQIFTRLGGTSVEKDVLDALTERLADSGGNVRAAAALALGQLGTVAVTPEVIVALLRCCTDSEWYVREAAAKAIGQMGQTAATPEVLSVLLRLLTDLKWAVRRAAAEAIGRLGQTAATPEVFSTLLNRLASAEWEVRDGAASALRNLGQLAATPEVLSALLSLLVTPDRQGDVEMVVASTLGKLGSVTAAPEILSMLLQSLTNPEKGKRVAAANTLAFMGQAAATPEVLSTLLKLLSDPEEEARFLAVMVLGKMGQAAATPEVLSALLKLLSDPQEDDYVRQRAAQSLGSMKQAAATPEVLSTLLKLLSDPRDSLRKGAVEALGQIGRTASPQVFPALIALLADPGEGMRAAVVEALGQLGAGVATPEVVAALLKCLTDAEWSVRWAAAKALGQLGPAAATPEVVAALLKCLTDAERSVRWAAAKALENLSAHIRPQERLKVMKLFLSLARRRDAESRETEYVGLRNLLAGDHSEAAPA